MYADYDGDDAENAGDYDDDDVCMVNQMIVTFYKDDERKFFIDSHPQVIASLTEKVASDLSQARAFSEMVRVIVVRLQGVSGEQVIPMPEKFAREEERMFEPERRDPRDLRWSQQGV